METDYSLFIRTHSLRGHIHQNFISKEKCNEKERKGGAGPRLEENGNQVDARGLPPSFKEEQAILEHVPSSSSFFSSSFICPTVPHFVFCRPRQFIFTPASCSSWLLQSTMDPSESGRDERLAGHGQPQATAGHKLEE